MRLAGRVRLGFYPSDGRGGTDQEILGIPG
jgi:hypothetical protein